MIARLKIKPFLDIQDTLVQWSMLLHNDRGYRDGKKVSVELRNNLRELLSPLMEELNAHEFEMCQRGCRRLINVLDEHDDAGRVVSAIDDLRRRLLDQAELVACLSLSPKERDLYEPKSPLFGSLFEARFATGGAFEVEEAAKCLALGRSTASVFHLMRAMEMGVYAVSRCLGISDPKPADRSWGKVLEKVRAGIDAKWPTVASRATGDGEVFELLHASLDAVKNPWRNATMHPANKYTSEEADHVFAAVRGFMMKLAARCDENGEPKA